jgi:hypothetical protein
VSEDRCPLSWKAAALEDGRLEGADRVSFDLHASRCADCRAERKALAALYAQLREPPARALAPLERARRRASLLARANDRFVGQPRRRTRWVLAASVVVLLVLLVVAGRSRLGMQRPPAELASTSPRFEVEEAPHAIWRTRSVGGTGRVELADGAARFSVERLGPNQRFLVALPDGELEITGRARFVAEVAFGRTSGVSSMAGDVVFRRREAPELVLHAGEGWTRTDVVVATSGDRDAEAPPAGAAVAAGNSDVTAARPPAVAASKKEPAVGARTAEARSSASSSRIAGEKFDEAISSFVHGSYALADTQLIEFARAFPADSRCEDAAFLSAVARWRLGDAQGARSRAEAYLGAYPNGLRRGEAQRIVESGR